MRKLIAVFLYAIFYPTIIKESRRTDSVLAIYGHDSKREPFEKLIKWFLKRDYHFITQYEFYDYLNGKKLVNNKNIYLSFDDGWRSNFTDVLPVLQKYNIPATIFLSTKGMRDGYYWFSNAFQNRQSSLYSKVDELWEMPNAMRMSIISKLPPFKGERETMNEREVLLMTESGLVSWGNHTDDHVISNNCSDIELKEEIEKCHQIIYKLTNQDSSFIYSYPNGNYDSRTDTLIKQIGFKMAATVEMGRNFSGDDPYKIKRFEFNNGCLAENVLHSYGIWTRFFCVIKSILKIKDTK